MKLLLLAALVLVAEAREAPTEEALVECALVRFAGGADALSLPQLSEAFGTLMAHRRWAKKIAAKGYPAADVVWAEFASDGGMTRGDARHMMAVLDEGKHTGWLRRAIGKLWC